MLSLILTVINWGNLSSLRILGLTGFYAWSCFVNYKWLRLEKDKVLKRIFFSFTLCFGLAVFGYLVLFFGPFSLVDWASVFQWIGWPIAILSGQWARYRMRNKEVIDGLTNKLDSSELVSLYETAARSVAEDV